MSAQQNVLLEWIIQRTFRQETQGKKTDFLFSDLANTVFSGISFFSAVVWLGLGNKSAWLGLGKYGVALGEIPFFVT